MYQPTPETSHDDHPLRFLRPDCVVTLPAGLGKEELLAFMVTALARRHALSSGLASELLSALLRRERLGTTGIGSGLALPHLRRKDVAEFIGIIGFAAEGIEFESLDQQPTRVVILVVSPFEQRERHLQILGRLATLFCDNTFQYSVQIPRSPHALLQLLGIRDTQLGE